MDGGTVRHLVAVVPGIGGSVLAADDPREPVIWDASLGGSGRVLVDPTRLSLAEYPELRPTGLVRGVTVLGRVTVLPGYAELVRSLGNDLGASSAVLTPERLPDPSAEILMFPYDFRLGVAAAAERLAGALHPLVTAPDALWPGRPVLLVAHSMGGLVARYWIGALGGWRHCAGLVTLGTPHRGAPKALDWLVNGVRVGRAWQRATNVVRGWPGAWDLIPHYPAIWDVAAGKPVRPENLPFDCVQAGGLLADTAGSIPAALAAGADTHADIAAGWGDIPAGRAPAVHVVFARGHRTVSKAVLDGGQLLVTREDPAWLPVHGWDGGDGTVPAVSAVPVELADDRRVRVPVWQRHGPMGCSPEATRIAKEYEAESTAWARGDGDPGITLDLDEFPALGSRVAATLHHADTGPETVLTLRARPAGLSPGPARRWVDTPMNRMDEATWETELPISVAGTYEVCVSAAGVPRVSPVPVTDVIEVLTEAETAAGGAVGAGVDR